MIFALYFFYSMKVIRVVHTSDGAFYISIYSDWAADLMIRRGARCLESD
jgi:hypothetical protein